MKVRNEERTHFWGDTWCGSTSLKDFPMLFNLWNDYNITEAEAANKGWLFTYRRWLSADLLIQNVKSREIVERVTLTPENDIPTWDW
jgi:hypothetical protein